LCRSENALTSAAEESVGVKKACMRRKKTTLRTDRVKETVKGANFRNWMKTRTWEYRQAYCHRAKRVNLAEKSRIWVQLGKDL